MHCLAYSISSKWAILAIDSIRKETSRRFGNISPKDAVIVLAVICGASVGVKADWFFEVARRVIYDRRSHGGNDGAKTFLSVGGNGDISVRVETNWFFEVARRIVYHRRSHSSSDGAQTVHSDGGKELKKTKVVDRKLVASRWPRSAKKRISIHILYLCSRTTWNTFALLCGFIGNIQLYIH